MAVAARQLDTGCRPHRRELRLVEDPERRPPRGRNGRGVPRGRYRRRRAAVLGAAVLLGGLVVWALAGAAAAPGDLAPSGVVTSQGVATLQDAATSRDAVTPGEAVAPSQAARPAEAPGGVGEQPVAGGVVVQPGDTLWGLAEVYAPPGQDRAAYARRLATYNDLDPTALEPGAVIRLPPQR